MSMTLPNGRISSYIPYFMQLGTVNRFCIKYFDLCSDLYGDVPTREYRNKDIIYEYLEV